MRGAEQTLRPGAGGGGPHLRGARGRGDRLPGAERGGQDNDPAGPRRPRRPDRGRGADRWAPVPGPRRPAAPRRRGTGGQRRASRTDGATAPRDHRSRRPGRGGARRRGARARGPHRRCRAPGRRLLPRHATAPGSRRRHARRPRGAVAGRAGQRSRSRGHALAAAAAAHARRRGTDGAAVQPRAERGRADRRLGGDRQPGPAALRRFPRFPDRGRIVPRAGVPAADRRSGHRAVRRPVVTTLLRAEYRKLRTTRVGWILLLVAQVIVLAGVSGLVLSDANLRDRGNVTKAVAHVGLAALCTLILGIFAVAGEYRHRTITDTYLSTPRRVDVLTAKLATYFAAGLVMGITSSATALVTMKVWWAAKGVPLDLGSGAVWRTVSGGIAWNAAFAVIGVAVGALVRNLTGAVAAALAWIALVEGIVGQLLGDGLSRWLPFTAAQALGRATVGNTGHLPQWGAGALLVGYAAVIGIAAA